MMWFGAIASNLQGIPVCHGNADKLVVVWKTNNYFRLLFTWKHERGRKLCVFFLAKCGKCVSLTERIGVAMMCGI